MIWRDDSGAPAIWNDPTARDMPEIVPEYWGRAARNPLGYGLPPPHDVETDTADRLFWLLAVSALIQGGLSIVAGVLVWGMR